MAIGSKGLQNIKHVETSVASHCKPFKLPIASQSQVNYVQRVTRV